MTSIRQFVTGATRDTDEGKLDYEAFLSPWVLKRYAEYLHQHRLQKDGSTRAGDNWQKGIPKDVYIKSAFRHFMDWWIWHRSQADAVGPGINPEEAMCGLLFNVMGYLHETLKDQRQ